MQNEIVRRYGASAPIMDATHLVGTWHPVPSQPLPKAGHGDIADLVGCTLQRDAPKGYEISELHDRLIPHNGELSQPRFGERRRGYVSGTIPTMGNRLKELRLSRKLTHAEAAEVVGVSRSQFIKLERGERRLTADYITQIAKGFDVSPAEVISEITESLGTVPIVGKAGAGPDGSVLFSEGDGGLGYGPAAPNTTERTQALEVEGDSMRGIANDGWLVYYDDEPLHPSEDLFGELCVVGLEDGRVLVKVLQPGRGSGLFDLESFNAPVMRDVPVRWACVVTSIIPRKPARRLIKDAARGA